MNKIFFGDNLPILRQLPDESIDLIYIDPPFNTGKTQSLKSIRTILSKDGDRKGFQGNTYQTFELGEKSYKDNFNNSKNGDVSDDVKDFYFKFVPEGSVFFLEGFLRPRLIEAYRLLKPNGSLYFHIDYREVHYCKLLLDSIFGRDSFLNEIIWAYDFGGRSRSKWPAKHDNILFYVKNPKDYIFNTNQIDREKYMAPGLVGPEKAKRGKLPTDSWFWSYVGMKGMRNADYWWMTIVGTNSYERTGYPTQKPIKLINRIIKASSFSGSVVLDFFAGSGTVGESCIKHNREFILIDNNIQAMHVMERRFSSFAEIEWIGYEPTGIKRENEELTKIIIDEPNEKILTQEFKNLVSISSNIQAEWEDKCDLWKNSPFEWIVLLPARSKSRIARILITKWLKDEGIEVEKGIDSSETLAFFGNQFAVKFSTLWTSGIYQFQQIRAKGPDFILCLGISPMNAHCWVIPKKEAITNGRIQHKGSEEYLLTINPSKLIDWVRNYGGTMKEALSVIKKMKKNE